jgi:hypothetical protein
MFPDAAESSREVAGGATTALGRPSSAGTCGKVDERDRQAVPVT